MTLVNNLKRVPEDLQRGIIRLYLYDGENQKQFVASTGSRKADEMLAQTRDRTLFKRVLRGETTLMQEWAKYQQEHRKKVEKEVGKGPEYLGVLAGHFLTDNFELSELVGSGEVSRMIEDMKFLDEKVRELYPVN